MIFLEDKPWLIDAFEVLELGLTTYFIDDRPFRRLTIIILDNAIEIAMWNYLKYEKGIQPPGNNFNELVEKTKSVSPARENKTSFFNKIKYYHEQRNPLYHQGTKIMDLPREELLKQCVIVLELFGFIFSEEFEEFLMENKKVSFIKENIELEVNILSKKLDTDKIREYDKVKDFIESNCPYEGLPFNNLSDPDFLDITDTIREIKNSL
jgi:hypothetical protein